MDKPAEAVYTFWLAGLIVSHSESRLGRGFVGGKSALAKMSGSA